MDVKCVSPQSKKKKKSDSPLAKLSPEELEELGMEAVDEGVEPTKLQQAYASAQVPRFRSLTGRPMSS